MSFIIIILHNCICSHTSLHFHSLYNPHSTVNLSICILCHISLFMFCLRHPLLHPLHHPLFHTPRVMWTPCNLTPCNVTPRVIWPPCNVTLCNVTPRVMWPPSRCLSSTTRWSVNPSANPSGTCSMTSPSEFATPSRPSTSTTNGRSPACCTTYVETSTPCILSKVNTLTVI